MKKASAPRDAATRGRLIKPIRHTLALALVPTALFLTVAPATASADSLPGGSGACLGADCQAATPAGDNGSDTGTDASDTGTASDVPAAGNAAGAQDDASTPADGTQADQAAPTDDRQSGVNQDSTSPSGTDQSDMGQSSSDQSGMGQSDAAAPGDDAQGTDTTSDGTQTDSTQADNTQSDSTQADNTQTDSTQADNTQSDSTQAGSPGRNDENWGNGGSGNGGWGNGGGWGDDSTGSTSVHKVDAYTQRSLAGATFQLWRESNGIPGLQSTGGNRDSKVGAPCVTPNSGVCSADHLKLGTYYWQEIAAPPGYDLPSRVTIPVVIDCDHLKVDVTAKDYKTVTPTGSTSDEKVDGRTGKPLAGAVFQLWHETNGVPGLQTMGGNPDSKVGAPCVTPNSGVCSADHLQFGTYYWQEISAPPGYDLPDHATLTVVIDCDHTNVDVIAKDYRMIKQTGSTSVKKVDARSGKPLAGATFQLWRETNGIPGLQSTGGYPDSKVGGPCVTPYSGVCSADHLQFGTYYWQEIAAPLGYDLPGQPVTKVVLSYDHSYANVVMKDYRVKRQPGFTSVEKVDGRTGKPLAGATFQLWRETNGIPGLQTTGAYPDSKVGGPCVTPASGICSAKDLPLGTYYWQETAAPRGYWPRQSVTTVTLDREHPCATVKVKDWRGHGHHHGHLPSTGFEGSMWALAGLALLGAGGLATVAARRRRPSRR